MRLRRAAHASRLRSTRVEWIDTPDIDADFEGFRLVWADVAWHHRELWDDPRVSGEVAVLIDAGRAMTGVEYARSRAHAEHVRAQFSEVLRTVDALLTPTTPYPAPRADQEEAPVTGGVLDVRRGSPSRLTVPINEAGLPAVAFPVGTTSGALPLSAQLIGRPYTEVQLLAVVVAFQGDDG